MWPHLVEFKASLLMIGRRTKNIQLISSRCLVVRFFLTLFHYNVLIPSGHYVYGGVGGIKGLNFISEFGFLENKS